MTLTTKQVRFNTKDIVAYTHSATEYDRSPFKDADIQLYNIRKKILQECSNSNTTTYNPKLKPTLLKINTTLLGNNGPLFFTNLSTDYHKFDSSLPYK